MPYHDAAKGITPYKDDACLGCAALDICNVITDLNMNETASKYHEMHLVPVGHGADRENYIECQGYIPYIAPKDKPDPAPLFGTRVSQQEKEIMADPKKPWRVNA